MSNSFERLKPEDIALFCGDATTIEDLKKAKWHIYGSSSGAWWFRHEDGRRFHPAWIHEIEHNAERCGRNSVRGPILYALGIQVDKDGLQTFPEEE